MFAKIVVTVLLLAIVASLLTSMVFLIKDPSSKRRALTGLKVRVALSMILIAFVILSYFMGWMHPHPVIPPAAQ
jgi:hypothetical protein